jgi:hypothetical protein
MAWENNATFRLSLIGAEGPHLFDIVEVIGKEETISRIITLRYKILKNISFEFSII